MVKYRKKPVVVEAVQWWKDADHPRVEHYGGPWAPCSYCKQTMTYHGWIKTLEGGHVVCPGDWVITGVKGEHYACKPDVFAATYEKVEEKKRCWCQWEAGDSPCPTHGMYEGEDG